MTSMERVEAAIRKARVDRVPWSLWRHFPGDDLTPKGLSEAVLAFQKRHGFDLVKVTPAGGYSAEAWGVRMVPTKSEEGVRAYASRVVREPRDWRRLRASTTAGVFGRELDALRRIRRGLDGSVPMVQTIFSPLTVAKQLAGELWLTHLRHFPRDLAAGLEIIENATTAFALDCLKAGADGIFFATQLASRDICTEGEYRRFGEPFDREVLGAVRDRTPFVLLHVHGKDILFDRLRRYPATILNWHDRLTPPSLAQGLRQFRGACLGGLNEWGALRKGPPAEAAREALQAIRETGGRGLILGPGCVISTATPERHIAAVARALAT